jgi:SAM-dependent methyltransferase
MLLRIIDTAVIKYTKLFSRKGLYSNLDNELKKIQNKSQKTVLNIGSGGKVLEAIKKHGFEVIEIDIDPKRNPDYVISIEDMSKFKNNEFDIILCLEVLEHVENPFKGIEESYRVLKKDGLFIGSTPFLFPIHDEPYDFYRYTRYGLKKMFSKFSSFKVKEKNSYFESIYVLVLRSYFNKSRLEKLFFIILLPVIILLFIPVYILSLFFNLKNATSGYFFIGKK